MLMVTSAFVGLAVMLVSCELVVSIVNEIHSQISFPLPGYMTSILRTVQVQKMKKVNNLCNDYH